MANNRKEGDWEIRVDGDIVKGRVKGKWGEFTAALQRLGDPTKLLGDALIDESLRQAAKREESRPT